MEKLESYETEKYVPSKEIPFTMTYRVNFLLKQSFWVLKIFVFMLFEYAEMVLDIIMLKSSVKDISGQVALVTGGANGLGREVALRLAKLKCKIVIADLNQAEAHETATYIEKVYNVQVKAFKIDISDVEAVKILKNDIESSLGPVDILINNAGVMPLISLREGQTQDIQKIIDINLTSHFWTVRTFLDGMIERKRGHIVGLSSLAGKIALPLGISYTATKFGVRGFMSALYDELCAFDHDEYVKVTTVFPSFVNTRKVLGDLLDNTNEMTPRMPPEYVADKIVDGILKNKRDVTLPPGSNLLTFLNLLPDKTTKYAKTQIPNLDHLKNVMVKQRKC